MHFRTALYTFAWASLVCLTGDVAWACPGCKDAIKAQANGANIAMGYQYSILFMMAMPFTMLTLFSAYMYWEIRRAQAAKDAEQAQSAPRQVIAEREPAAITDG